ncbi:phosphohistidine phosphatase SixA [Acidovorax delafieldii]|uniref:histidine phosphatase family protein n=1 Tax=Acidovorax delafieldii TaxID=47920 RepID=UPI0028578DF0|nr:histidine phosphatase family protein [Acidovorax delafieldii]MDR6154253.1 phosphohistidine phosphatase SixA [Acidovorax delafieldii]
MLALSQTIALRGNPPVRRATVGACMLAVAAAAGWPGVCSAQDQDFQETLVSPALLAQMRRGGFVLYLRHGATDSSRVDQAPQVDLNDCNTQRVLSDAGRQQARELGVTLQRARIPVGEVIHSPLCRARESAQLTFATQPQLLRAEPLLAYTANLTSEQKKPVIAATRALVSTPVPAGTNRVIVAHAPNMADLMGYFVKPEGTMVVLRPLGQSRFEYLGSIPPSHWAALLPASSKR